MKKYRKNIKNQLNHSIKLLFLMGIFYSNSVLAGDYLDFCRGGDVKISFQVDYGRPTYKNVSTNQLKSYSSKLVSGHKTSRGLTEASFSEKMDVSFKLSQLDNQVCVEPSAVKVYMGYSSMNVYIDNKYRRNSCEYETVLGHENQHVKIYQIGLQKYAKTISSKIYDLLLDLDPIQDTVFSGELSQSQWKEYTSEMNEIINSKIENNRELQELKNQMNSYIKMNNNALDSEGNYSKTQKRCKNW